MIREFFETMTPMKFLWTLIGSFLSVIAFILIYVSIVISHGLPSLEQLENPKQNFATRVYSADGKLLDHYFIERRVWVPFDSIPKDFFNALISVEDRDFYSHWGVNASRIIKAGLKNVMFMGIKGGASTITQQLARNLFFNQAQTLSRKIKEAFTAIQIEKTYTKQEILEMYANTVSFGKGAYGIQVAAQVYFNKPAYEMTLSECAFLVGLLQRPEKYNGSTSYDLAINRRNYVLYLMEDAGYISGSQRSEARQNELNFTSAKDRRTNSLFASHFVEMIRQDLAKDEKLKDRDLYRDGLVIYTTLDSRIQDMAQKSVEEHLAEYQQTFNKSWRWQSNMTILEDHLKKAIKNNPKYISAASDAEKLDVERGLRNNPYFVDSIKNMATTIQTGLVIIDPHTGAILGMVGGSPKFMAEHRDAKYSLNHAVQIRRQPGSTFKPFVYASALEEGLSPSATIESGPFSYTMPSGEVWSPRGSGGGEGGAVSLATALQRSINTVSARLITQHTTPQKVVDLAKRMGIKSPLKSVPALALGAGGEVSPLEMVSAFSTFANEGVHQEPFYITRIEDQYGNVVYERKKVNIGVDAISPRIAQTMVRFMQGTVDGGTGYRIRNYFKNCDAAGKTGTTNDYADAWFIGYTPQLVAGLWVGFDDKRITFTGGYGYAGEAAAPLWGRLMAKIYDNDYLPYKQRKFNFNKLDSSLARADSTQLFDGADPNADPNSTTPATPPENPPTKQTPDKQAPLPNGQKKRV
jgi:penicillin-binding protein 1A